MPVNSSTFANEETWFELIGAELLVEHSTAGGFAEAAGTELCKGNFEEIADVELDITGTYPLANVKCCCIPNKCHDIVTQKFRYHCDNNSLFTRHNVLYSANRLDGTLGK